MSDNVKDELVDGPAAARALAGADRAAASVARRLARVERRTYLVVGACGALFFAAGDIAKEHGLGPTSTVLNWASLLGVVAMIAALLWVEHSTPVRAKIRVHHLGLAAALVSLGGWYAYLRLRHALGPWSPAAIVAGDCLAGVVYLAVWVVAARRAGR